ncbi:MAG: GH3 auxin-responsive promoter family protein, partial [Candidatus Nanohaloarchaea archaeon]
LAGLARDTVDDVAEDADEDAPDVGVVTHVEHGPPSDVFPNMKKGLFSGDMLRPDQRSRLAGQWAFDIQHEFYAASEIGIIAAATDDTRRMVPMLHRYVLEIEDSDGNIVDIREVEEPREGSLLVTDPARTAVDVTRYELGDQVRAWPGELPDIEVLGRNDDTINFSGAHLHPSEIYEAATQAYGDDVRCVPYASTPDDTAVDFYIVGAESDASSAFIDELFDVSGALRQAYHEDGFVEYLDVHHVDSMDETPAEPAPGPKSVHVVFDGSYRG